MTVEQVLARLVCFPPEADVVVRTQDGTHLVMTVGATEVRADGPNIVIVGDIDDSLGLDPDLGGEG